MASKLAYQTICLNKLAKLIASKKSKNFHRLADSQNQITLGNDSIFSNRLEIKTEIVSKIVTRISSTLL